MSHSNENPSEAAVQQDGNNLIDQFFSVQGTTIPSDFKSGFVAIVGRPNVGKSTLMNHLLGQKLSITSRKPQTTRHKIVGIDSREKSQAVFVDTPGMHKIICCEFCIVRTFIFVKFDLSIANLIFHFHCLSLIK